MTIKKKIRIGVWNFYEELNRDGHLFKNDEASIGAGLLKPWRYIFEEGSKDLVDFFTLDQVVDPYALDAILLIDRPRDDHPLIEMLLNSPIRKYLLIYESEVIKPDNWDPEYHSRFDRIFTWHDSYVDGSRYLKINFAIDRTVKVSSPAHRKLSTLIAGAKLSKHPKELYSQRIKTIRWMELNAPSDFEFFGYGWPPELFSSYCGAVNDKLATLAQYNFAFCYENAKEIPGYITEKILDCFLAGTIPIYKGAPNISQWIPTDCYIDADSFDSLDATYNFIKSQDSGLIQKRREKIVDFLNSSASVPFSIECFVSTLLGTMVNDIRVNSGVSLRQDRESLTLVPEPTITTAQEIRRSLVTAKHPQLVVYLGYGPELPVFLRTRALWNFYASHFPNIDINFVRTSSELPRGQVRHDGYDLLVGIGENSNNQNHEKRDYRQTGIWAPEENSEQIFRQMVLFNHFLRERTTPFFLYHSTITSVVDFRSLVKALNHMPPKRCLAGMPGRLTSPPQLAGLNFVCGTNALFSHDVMAMLLERYDPANPSMLLPNDIWQALLLPDVPRRCLPFFTFGEPRSMPLNGEEVSKMTKMLVAHGHFHFRIKTTSEQEGLGPREDIDPWIMIHVMQGILGTSPPPGAVSRLLEALIASAAPTNGLTLTANDEPRFFQGPRSFPLNDSEARQIFRDL